MGQSFPRQQPTGRLRIHCFREFGITTFANLGINTWVIRKAVGKKISPDMEAYLTDLKTDEAFSRYEATTKLNTQYDEQFKIINALLAHPEKLSEIQDKVQEYRKLAEE